MVILLMAGFSTAVRAEHRPFRSACGFPPGRTARLPAPPLSAPLPSLRQPPDTVFSAWAAGTVTEFDELQREYAEKSEPVFLRLLEVNTALFNPRTRRARHGYTLLWEKMQLEEHLRQLRREIDLKVVRLRYRKSIEMLKMLYEKILSMDHHFTSLKAHQQVLRISNPHEYPEFKEVKVVLEERLKKRSGIALPVIMESNPFLSAVFSVIGLTLGSETRLNKEQLDKIGCILDFTVSMHQDLNLVFYETEYLRDANLTLRRECESLFTDCARQVGYTIPLASCRDSDDWERLYALLDNYIGKALNLGGGGAAPDPAFQQRAGANLAFSVDRVVRFIEKYGAFVAQGNEYYKKFGKIVGSYDNEKACSAVLPEQFSQLKNDIGTTLDKFISAYNLPEIQGSRLKDLLYGLGE
jgi:hypothetical protein